MEGMKDMYNNYTPYLHHCTCRDVRRIYRSGGIHNIYKAYPHPYYGISPMNDPYCPNQYDRDYGDYLQLRDYGPEPFVINIEQAAEQNNTFRTALWTGKHLQLTLMSIGVGEDIGLEMHPNLDQFIRIEEGQGIVLMGNERNKLNFQRRIYDGYVIFIPAGTWHNIINTGYKPIKLYSIYAPPQHPHGTVHRTKAEAEADEH